MTNDFSLFPAAHDDPMGDPDVALITAYLARELSLVQIVAVEERLATDTAFASKMRPIIEGWVVPGPSGVSGARKLSTTLTPDEIERGWHQRLSGGVQNARSLRVTRARDVSTSARTRIPMARIAAVVAITVLPVFAFAQVVKYVASHPNAPGHGFIQALVPAAWRAPKELPGNALRVADSELSWLVDAPVQQALPVIGEQEPQPAPVVDLPAASARTTRALRAILGIKHADDGRVLVNDPLSRQLLLFERDLATASAVLDSVRGTSRSYSEQVPDPDNAETWRVLRPFVGDSAVFMFLPGTNIKTALVLDARGSVVRVITVGRTVGRSGDTHWDQQGRPVSLTSPPARTFTATTDTNNYSTIPYRSDTLPILRLADFATQRVDTLGTILLPEDRAPRRAGVVGFQGVGNGGGRLAPVTGPDGVLCTWASATTPPGCTNTAKQVVNPLYVVDDWALLSDGTVAFVRGSDYRIDWIRPDGSKSSSGKLPFERKPLTDADKQRIVDSTRAAIDSLDSLAIVNEEKWKPWKDSVANVARAAGARRINGELAHPGPPVRLWPYEIVPLAQIADYYPPIRPGAAKPDADGNLWILPRTTSLSRQGELVYDVVNPTRGLAQRVRLPVGRSIAGFGKGGIVYLQHGDLKSGFILERSALPAPIPK